MSCVKDVTIPFCELKYGDIFVCDDSDRIYCKTPIQLGTCCNAVVIEGNDCLQIAPSQPCYVISI